MSLYAQLSRSFSSIALEKVRVDEAHSPSPLTGGAVVECSKAGLSRIAAFLGFRYSPGPRTRERAVPRLFITAAKCRAALVHASVEAPKDADSICIDCWQAHDACRCEEGGAA